MHLHTGVNTSFKVAVPNFFGTRDHDSFFMDLEWQGEWFQVDSSASCLLCCRCWADRSFRQKWKWWGATVNTGETLLGHLLLISGCAAWFLTGHELVPVCGPGVGDPDVKYLTVFHTPWSHFRFFFWTADEEMETECLCSLTGSGLGSINGEAYF